MLPHELKPNENNVESMTAIHKVAAAFIPEFSHCLNTAINRDSSNTRLYFVDH
jgi:hypothetical protein